jgi:hypothetical protein
LPGFNGSRPGSIVGQRPNAGNRPVQNGDNLGIVNRPTINQNFSNRQNSISNRVVNNNVTNVTNVVNNNRTVVGGNNVFVNRGGWGGAGYGWGGRPSYAGWSGASPYAAYHRGWVNGYWNAHNSGWGWGNSALGWGVGIGVAAWGVGSLFNSWGYSSFVNPYYAAQPVVVQNPAVVVQQPIAYDYSRPIDVASAPPAQSVIDQAGATFDSARAAFQAADYQQALSSADQALRQTPNDPILHEFRAMCLFGLGRYDEAAAPLYTVLSVGPGWDWTTQSGLYPDIGIYTQQLRALEAYCNANPRAASARFVLAVLYMTQGSNDAAVAQFKQVTALQPQDRLSAQLLDALTPKPRADTAQAPAQPASTAAPVATDARANEPPPDTPQPAPDQAGQQTAEGPPFPAGPVPAKLFGSWTANPAKDVAITLTLSEDTGFSWKVVDRGQAREFQGKATFDNDTLALVPPDQPPMVGTVTGKDNGGFQFKAVGAPPADPGLIFQK